MLGGFWQGMLGRACALALAVTLIALTTLCVLLAVPAVSAASTAPTPDYPAATDGPSQPREPHVPPEDEGIDSPGNFMAADGRVVPGVGWLTESIDQAVLWKLRPRVDQDRLINVARGLPLAGRKIMLTVDEAEPGATRPQMRQDAEATADAMVTEYRTGMPLAHWTPGSEDRPRLGTGWVMLTVMVPAGDAETSTGPVTGPDTGAIIVVERGQGVSLAAEDSTALIEQVGAGLTGEGDLTEGLDALVQTAVAQTVPPPEGAGLTWTSWTEGRTVLWVVLAAALAAVAVVPRVLTARRRRRAVSAHSVQPGWYADAAQDPALRLRGIVEALGLALDTPGARDLPSAQTALAALVENTLELDRVAPRSRSGRTTPGWQTGRGVLEARVQDAEQLLHRLVTEGQRARRPVRFSDEVRRVQQVQQAGKVTR